MDEEQRRQALRRAGECGPAVVAGAAVLLVGLAWQANLQATGPVRGGTGSSYQRGPMAGRRRSGGSKRTNRLFMPNPGGVWGYGCRWKTNRAANNLRPV